MSMIVPGRFVSAANSLLAANTAPAKLFFNQLNIETQVLTACIAEAEIVRVLQFD